MTEILTGAFFDCETGKTLIRPLNEAELAAREAMIVEAEAARAAEEAAAAERAALKESALAKLVSGTKLTAEEAALIVI